LKASEALPVLPADMGNAIVILNMADCNLKIAALLECQAYRKLKKDCSESIERKTFLLLKKYTISDEVCQRIRPQVSRSPRLHVLPKIHEQLPPLRPNLSTFWAPTYHFAKHLAGLLGSHPDKSPLYVKNMTNFVRTLRSIRSRPQNLMVSFSFVSLFTRVPSRDKWVC
jgi:hypothetical protein